MAKTNAVEEVKNTSIIAATMNFEEDAGMGLENVDNKSLAIPFLGVLQALSPQCQDVSDGGIEGAKAGRLINTITNELFETVEVIPVAFKREFLRWAPNRGGFRGSYPAIDVDLNKVAGMSQHNGRILMDVIDGQPVFDGEGRPKFDFLNDTRNHFVLAKSSNGSWFPALLSLSSTQIKKSKRWLSLISGIEVKRADGSSFTPPSFSHVYKISTVKEENDKGKWHGINVEIVGPVTEPAVYAKAKQFSLDVTAGAVEVSPPPSEVETETAADKF